PIAIPRPFVNVVCGVQPDMLGELGDQKARSDGFLDRILFTFPRPVRGADWDDATVTEGSRAEWQAALTSLRALEMQEMDDGVPGHKVVRFSPAAKEAWRRWWDGHAAEIRGADLPVNLIGPWSKLRSYAARLVLVLHYLWLVQAGG